MSNVDNSWIRLVEQLERTFKESGNELPQAIKDDGTFRAIIEKLCKKHKEVTYPQRLVSGLITSYGNIIKFAEAIAETQPLGPDAISRLVWATSAIVFQRGSTAGIHLDGLKQLIIEFNSKVPEFTSDFGLVSDVSSVQKPLQEIFKEYVGFHILLISQLDEMTYKLLYNLSNDKDCKQRLEETGRRLKDNKDEFTAAVAEEERKRVEADKMVLARRPKATYLTNGDHLEKHKTEPKARFKSLRWLGRGTQGEVHEVMETSTKLLYACKQIHFRSDRPSDEKEILNEVAIMQKLRHPHIAQVLFPIKDLDAYNIIMLPVADSDLSKYLDRCVANEFSYDQIKFIHSWFGSLADALQYAHQSNVIHGDIKPANILIKSEQPYLSDFGLARDFTGADTSSTPQFQEQGTPVYRAPESQPTKPMGRKADVYALGCVFSEMLTVNGKRTLKDFRKFRKVEDSNCGPFAFRENPEKVTEWIAKFRREGPNCLNNIIIEEIQNMLKQDPSQRYSAREVVNCLRQETAFFCWKH